MNKIDYFLRSDGRIQKTFEAEKSIPKVMKVFCNITSIVSKDKNT